MGGPHLLACVAGLGSMDAEDMRLRGLVFIAVGYFAVVVFCFWLVLKFQ